MVQGTPLWTWDTGQNPPVVTGYPSGLGKTPGPTKTGLLPSDLQNFISIPIQTYGNPPKQIEPDVQMQWIRWAEDYVEQDCGLLLCPTWVASPVARPTAAASAAGITVAGPLGFQQAGFDFDLGDTAYDFFYERARDESWMISSTRYRPLRVIGASDTNFTAIKLMSYIYPLLNEYFRVPQTWLQEDLDYGLVRLVPAANVQMLPLFAMQLAFMGFAESVPGSIWTQYTAGLTRYDYANRFSFIPQLVLAEAARTALIIMQVSVNIGALEYNLLMDGAQYKTKYDPNGAFAGQIKQYTTMRDDLLMMARNRVTGPVFTTV